MWRPSRTATLAPSRAAASAMESPASPAPMTQMSASRSNDSRARSRKPASSWDTLVKVSLMSFLKGLSGRLSPCPRPAPVDYPGRVTIRECHAPFAAAASRQDRDRRAERPRPGPRLDDRGHKDAAEIGDWMASHPPFPEAVLVSHAVRARQTWDIAWE